MKTKIDFKSALFGLAIGVLVTLGIAAASSLKTVGRYQIAGTDTQGLVIDTATGQVWACTVSGYNMSNCFNPKLAD